VSAQDKRLVARRISASRLAESEAVSLAAISAEGKAVRLQLNKVYAALQQTRAQRQRLIIFGWVAAATVLVLLAILLGWRNTLKGQGTWSRSRASLAWTAVAALFVFGLFASPIFGVAPPEATTNAEEADRQAAVDQATRVTTAASRQSAQAWVLGTIAAQWSSLDAEQGSALLAAATQASRNKLVSAPAYWGQAQSLRESAAAWQPSTLDLADFGTERVAAAAGQNWERRAIAADWANVDRTRATGLLEEAISQARHNPNPYYRDLEMRGVSVVWARLDPAQGQRILDEVADPMLRAWGLREIGAYPEAAEAARRIISPYDRAWSLREIAAVAPSLVGGPLLGEALDAALKVEEAQSRAYALADIAAAWPKLESSRGLEVLALIDGAEPIARTLALHGIAVTLKSRDLFGKAVAQAAAIGEPYAAARYTAAIVPDYARLDAAAAVEAAAAIADPFLRDLAFRDIARVLVATDVDLARPVAARIASPGLRAQALAAAGSLPEAAALIDQAEDSHTLRDLGINWAASDPKAALAIVDKMDDNRDRAAVLLSVAVATSQSDQAQSAAAFERAVREAKAIRQSGEAFSAARALTRLALAYAPVNKATAADVFALAADLARKANVSY
jgi:hypothetical protein